MLVPPGHSSQLTDPQSPMYCFTQLAAWFLFIILLCLVATFFNVFRSRRRSWNRSSVSVLSQELLKAQEAYTTTDTIRSIDHHDSKIRVNDTRSSFSRANLSFGLLAIMILFAICGLLLWGHLSSASSLQSGLQSIAGFSSQAPSPIGLQEFLQLYQPISLDSSGSSNCDVEILLMDHVFGASYGAPFVGKRSRELLLLVV